MIYKNDYRFASSEAIEDAIGEQIEEIRLRRNITQSRLAREAGVSRSTITRLARKGAGISLDSFIRILKALQLAHNLAAVLPIPEIRPLDELQKNNRLPRLRAREKKQDQKKWTWQDD